MSLSTFRTFMRSKIRSDTKAGLRRRVDSRVHHRDPPEAPRQIPSTSRPRRLLNKLKTRHCVEDASPWPHGPRPVPQGIPRSIERRRRRSTSSRFRCAVESSADALRRPWHVRVREEESGGDLRFSHFANAFRTAQMQQHGPGSGLRCVSIPKPVSRVPRTP
jgi:hypothetical protein